MRHGNILLLKYIGIAVVAILLTQYYNRHTCTILNSGNSKTKDLEPLFGIWCGKICWSNYVSDEFYNVWKELEDVHGWKEVSNDASPDRYWFSNDTTESYYKRYFKRIPDIVFYIETFDIINIHSQISDWRQIRHVWLFMNDVHAFNTERLISKKKALMKVNNIISTYPYKIDVEYSQENQTGITEWFTFQRTWLPHSASPSFLVAYNRNPKKKILLSGAISEAYPYRMMLWKMLNETPSSRLKDIIEYHRHPGYDPIKNAIQSGAREGYAPLINRYFAAITDTLARNYAVAKIFEIPAAGALLLLNAEAIPILARLNWFENVHYVTYNKTNMESVCLDVLSEESFHKYEKIRWTGHQSALEYHTTKRRALFLHNLAINTHLYG